MCGGVSQGVLFAAHFFENCKENGGCDGFEVCAWWQEASCFSGGFKSLRRYAFGRSPVGRVVAAFGLVTVAAKDLHI